jgi:hypothetical protein
MATRWPQTPICVTQEMNGNLPKVLAAVYLINGSRLQECELISTLWSFSRVICASLNWIHSQQLIKYLHTFTNFEGILTRILSVFLTVQLYLFSQGFIISPLIFPHFPLIFLSNYMKGKYMQANERCRWLGLKNSVTNERACLIL